MTSSHRLSVFAALAEVSGVSGQPGESLSGGSHLRGSCPCCGTSDLFYLSVQHADAIIESPQEAEEGSDLGERTEPSDAAPERGTQGVVICTDLRLAREVKNVSLV